MRQGRCAVAVALTTLAAPLAAEAQQSGAPPRPRLEARIDYLAGNPDAVHGGLGLNVPVGTYLRVELVGAGGVGWNDGRTGGSGRADLLARFSVDPFRERRWGLSAGGGLSIRYEALPMSGDRWRALVAVVLDLEGGLMSSVTPAIQLGLGGGARVGVILRGADRFRR